MCDNANMILSSALHASGADLQSADDRNSHELNTQFLPFVQSHVLEDICLSIATIGSIVVIAAVGYGFLYSIPWEDARTLYAITVTFFTICALTNSIIKYVTGPRIFVGTRNVLNSSVRIC